MPSNLFLDTNDFSCPPKVYKKRKSLWAIIYPIFTILVPSKVLSICGMKTKEVRNAWREKVALVSIIFLLCILLGFLTFGMNIVVCKGSNQYIYGRLPEFPAPVVIGNGEIYYSDEYEGLIHNLKTIKSSACKRRFGESITDSGIDPDDLIKIADIYFNFNDIKRLKLILINDQVYDPSIVNHSFYDEFIAKYAGKMADDNNLDSLALQCFKDSCYFGKLGGKTYGCLVADILLYLSTVIIFSLIIIKFVLSIVYSWLIRKKRVAAENLPCIMLVTCYSEDREGIKKTLDSLCNQNYNEKVILVIADGLVKGSGSETTTPDIIIELMSVDKRREATDYKSLNGTLNRGVVYSGTYSSDANTCKMVVIVKVGREDERSKPGNRGKRDSQVIIMGFFQKLLYQERMTDLDFEIYEAFKEVMDMEPACFEMIMMVDADTIVHPDALHHFNSAFVNDTKIMGMCGETKIINKGASWVTMIQVFEYYISHHLTKAFESIFGGVTCLPGCFCIYRIKIKEDDKYVPILANSFVLNPYSVTRTETLHEKNLLLLGEDRYLTTLLLKTFYRRKLIFLPAATCRTYVPDTFPVLLSQRRRWINSTVHNLMELVSVNALCGTFCCSMQFAVGVELAGTLVLPVSIIFTFVLIAVSILIKPAWIPLIMLACIFGLPVVLILITSFKLQYIFWLLIYILSLPVWNLVLPVYAFWHFDDFSWGETRKVDNDIGAHDTVEQPTTHHFRLYTLEERKYAKKRGKLPENIDDELIEKQIKSTMGSISEN